MNKILIINIVLLLCRFGFAEKLTPSSYRIQPITASSNCDEIKEIIDTSGNELIRVCKSEYRKCVLEGTCAIVSSRADTDIIENIHAQFNDSNFKTAISQINIINYIKLDKNKVPRFEVVNKNKCPFGMGARSICLDPFYTIAADLRYHKLGDVIFIPSAKGVALPSGEKHSGFFAVRDKGGGIKGENRFDFFLGFIAFTESINPFKQLGLSSKRNKIEFRKATSKETQAFLNKRNFPKVPQSN